MGRDFPGNPTEAENYYTVSCYNNYPFVVKVGCHVVTLERRGMH